ncbi:RNA pseudouridylate synthase domain-containing protein 2 isoform X1 [Drosophila sechellia]|uniref:Pseudouridylate synthase RPUSD2 n=1 Tax=Drosophila sechellia TaxID=7238 RepID=B4HWQ5_DROSE|nr:RNA pseudouridylate synthase domain-containing protein 2 isoform X1 [Drosophila sechellia]XP_032569931.1 RNA pseudouridylate synthase domain-containing protein 2 isoform X1 [Drosophila sechellia]EDW52450.1 GM11650 [Drosophila sechellia]
MQNSPAPCAWYLSWSLAAQQHQQKMLQMQSPFLDKMGSTTVGGIFAGQPQMQQPLSPNTAAAPPANYQQPALHPSAAPGAPHFHMGSPYSHLAPQLLNAGQLNQNALMHSAMFSSLPLGAYYAPAAGAGHSAFGGVPLTTAAQQSLLAATGGAPAGHLANQQTAAQVPVQVPVQMAQRTAPAACSMVQPLNCLPHQELNHLSSINLNLLRSPAPSLPAIQVLPSAEVPINKTTSPRDAENLKIKVPEKRKTDDNDQIKELKKAKLETKALKAKRPGFTDERYQETSYYMENGLRKVYPYYFTFTTFTKGRWVGEKILDIFSREFRAHPAEEYERCIQTGTLTVNFEKVPIDYRLKHNDLLANIVHRHEVPVTCQPIKIVHMDEDIVVVNKPASIPVHPCGRYRHNTVVFILAKEFNLKNLRTIHRLDRLTSGLLLFGRSPKKARQMEQQIRNRQVEKEYICRVEGVFPDGIVECKEPIEVVSYKIGVCKVSPKGKDCTTTFQKLSQNGTTSVVLCKPLTGRMHQIRVHLQYLGYPILNDPLYNHEVFGPLKGRSGDIGGKSDEELIRDLINIHNAENWLGIDCDSDISMFKSTKDEADRESLSSEHTSVVHHSDDDGCANSRETTPPCNEPQQPENSVKLLETTNAVKEYQVAAQKSSTEICPAPALDAVESPLSGGGCHVSKVTVDEHCYECKVHYRDPKSKDLIMYLHAWKYKGPGWEYETELPNWARNDWDHLDSA